jgi:hypothetical protein
MISPRPTPPIVVDDNGDLQVYSDVQAACLETEAYDVHALVAYDSLGMPLEFVTERYDVIDLSLVEGAASDPGELKRRLTNYVSRVGSDRIGISQPSSVSTEELLKALLRFFEAGTG